MIKYRTRCDEIKEVEVIRETPKQVVIKLRRNGERREDKRSNYMNWFNTWDEAHEFLVEQAREEVNQLCKRLDRAKGELGRIRGMKKEEAA
jgi:hypothetical protein